MWGSSEHMRRPWVGVQLDKISGDLRWQSTSPTRHLSEEAFKMPVVLATTQLHERPQAGTTRDNSTLIVVVLSHYILEQFLCSNRWSEQLFIVSFIKDSKNILNIIQYIIKLVLFREVTITNQLFGLSAFMISGLDITGSCWLLLVYRASGAEGYMQESETYTNHDKSYSSNLEINWLFCHNHVGTASVNQKLQ